MATAFDLWLGTWRTGQRMTETMLASASVVGHRTHLMQDAARDPLSGDYAELGRMVPEKVNAFAEAGTSLMTDLWAIQLENWTNWNKLALVALSGRTPTYSHWSKLAGQNYRSAQRSARAGDKALRPIHRTVMANEKRLRGAEVAPRA